MIRVLRGYLSSAIAVAILLVPVSADAKRVGTFIAVHMCSEKATLENYRKLRSLVRNANRLGIKLTLMFSPEWVDLADTLGVIPTIRDWETSDRHEISLHNHMVDRDPESCNGYSDLNILSYRSSPCGGGLAVKTEGKARVGSVADMLAKVNRLSPSRIEGGTNTYEGTGSYSYDFPVLNYQARGTPGGDPDGRVTTGEEITITQQDGSTYQAKLVSHEVISVGSYKSTVRSLKSESDASPDSEVVGLVIHSQEEKADALLMLDYAQDHLGPINTVRQLLLTYW